MAEFNFKSFYNIYKEALLDDNQTQAVSSLFAPIFENRNFPNNPRNKADMEYLVIDSKRASEWVGDNNRSVRHDVAKAAQEAAIVGAIVKHFEDVIVPKELSDYKLDSMVNDLLALALVSGIEQEKKNLLQQLMDDQETGEFLAQAFIFSLAAGLKPGKTFTGNSVKAVSEFDRVVLDRSSKPRTVVPTDIDETEMDYVNALLDAYEEATGKSCAEPEDVKDTEYEGHFKYQRKCYYQAETIHRAIRDSISEEDEDFDVLKDEIESGIYYVSHKKYGRGIDKADAVLESAGNIQLSHNTDNNMLGWIGAGEKQGVCHMLVNDHKLKWVEDNNNEK